MLTTNIYISKRSCFKHRISKGYILCYIKLNYNKFSATDAHFWIYLGQCRSTPKDWNKTDDGQDSASKAHTHCEHTSVTQSVRQVNRRHQARDASNAESRRPPPSHHSHTGPRNTSAPGIRKELSLAGRTCKGKSKPKIY